LTGARHGDPSIRADITSVGFEGLIECTVTVIPRTTNAIERLHEEFKRRIKTQTVLPSAETAAMLFWALLPSGQISMRKVDGWQTLATQAIAQRIARAA
jgi:transposase-like protein